MRHPRGDSWTELSDSDGKNPYHLIALYHGSAVGRYCSPWLMLKLFSIAVLLKTDAGMKDWCVDVLKVLVSH